MRGKEATCAALKSSKPLFRSDGGWQRASGFPFNPATAACTKFLSLPLHFPLQILFRSLLHYVALTKRRDFPDKTVPHSACLCTSVHHPDIRIALKGHYLVSTMKYDCVCLLLIMAIRGSCNDDKYLCHHLICCRDPTCFPLKKKKKNPNNK